MKLPVVSGVGRGGYAFLTAPPPIQLSRRPKMWETDSSHDKAPLTPLETQKAKEGVGGMHYAAPKTAYGPSMAVEPSPPAGKSLLTGSFAGHRPAPLPSPSTASNRAPYPGRLLGDGTGTGNENLHAPVGILQRMPPHEEVGGQEGAALSPAPPPLALPWTKPMRRVVTGTEGKVHGQVHDRTEPA